MQRTVGVCLEFIGILIDPFESDRTGERPLLDGIIFVTEHRDEHGGVLAGGWVIDLLIDLVID